MPVKVLTATEVVQFYGIDLDLSNILEMTDRNMLTGLAGGPKWLNACVCE